MKLTTTLWLILMAVIAAAVAVFAVGNAQPVQVRFLGWQAAPSLALLLIGAFLCGAFIVAAVSLPGRIRLGLRLRNLERQRASTPAGMRAGAGGEPSPGGAGSAPSPVGEPGYPAAELPGALDAGRGPSAAGPSAGAGAGGGGVRPLDVGAATAQGQAAGPAADGNLPAGKPAAGKPAAGNPPAGPPATGEAPPAPPLRP